MNLGQLASYATKMAGGRLDWELSEASFWINTAYLEVASVVKHNPLEALAVSSTTSGENKVALPPDFHYALALTLYMGSSSTASSSNNTTTVVLRQRDPRWIDSQNVNGTGDGSLAGNPEAYIIFDNWFELWPSPNSAYSLQLRYVTQPAVLVQSTDTPNLSDRWQTAVLYKSVELLEASRNNVEGEAMARNRYLNYVNTIPTDVAFRQKDRTGIGMAYRRKYE